MTDIVERLRRVAKELPQTSGNQAWLRPEDTTVWEAADEIEKLRAMLKEYDDAFEDWFPFVEGRKDDPNEETKACTRLVKAQRVARAALGEKE